MKIELNSTNKAQVTSELIILPAFSKGKKDINLDHWSASDRKLFAKVKSSTYFTAKNEQTFFFNRSNGVTVMALGLGEKKDFTAEALRKSLATAINQLKANNKQIEIEMNDFLVADSEQKFFKAALEAIVMTDYSFNEFKKPTPQTLKKVVIQLTTIEKKIAASILKEIKKLGESISIAKDFVNTPPNILNSEEFAKRIEEDAKKISGVKVKILGKKALEKEKCGLFLSVNAGSAYEPKLVHLTYTPAKVTKETKHIALVGKGLTFDSGGYSLKPSASMMNMKFDMAGAATVYGAFRAAALMGVNVKVSCFLGMTDNMVNSLATVPDSVMTARNGKTVEILNTDAEGRLVLADVLDYACDQKPDEVIDAATLTGAVLVSLGHEICGVMGNNQELIDALNKSAKECDEYMWQLPIIPEFHKDIKSPIADIKNIGGSRFGGSAKAGAFLENFIQDGIAWAHLDIAGVGDSQSHLPYCPSKGASGLIIRTLVHHITGSAK
jgi:leucyl aminopeptidase